MFSSFRSKGIFNINFNERKKYSKENGVSGLEMKRVRE